MHTVISTLSRIVPKTTTKTTKPTNGTQILFMWHLNRAFVRRWVSNHFSFSSFFSKYVCLWILVICWSCRFSKRYPLVHTDICAFTLHLPPITPIYLDQNTNKTSNQHFFNNPLSIDCTFFMDRKPLQINCAPVVSSHYYHYHANRDVFVVWWQPRRLVRREAFDWRHCRSRLCWSRYIDIWS